MLKQPGDLDSIVLCLLIYRSTNRIWGKNIYLGVDFINKQIYFTSW